MLENVTVRFNKCFKTANECKKRYRVLMGGAGSGKSVNVAQDFIIKLMNPNNHGANLLVVRKVEQSNRNSTFAELTSAAARICKKQLSSVWEIKESSTEMRCRINGNRIIFCGFNDLRQREKIKSINFPTGKLTWIWIEEATELSENDIEILDDRLRGDLENDNLYYQITLTFNPVSSRHWIKKRYFDVVSDDVYTHHSTYLDNDFIDKAFHRRMETRKKFDPEGYRVYALGEWGAQEGLKVRGIAINSAMKAISGEFKIKDLDVVKMLIDVDSVTLSDDGVTIGLDEQIKQIQKQRPYLFGDDTLNGRIPISGEGTPSGVSKEQFTRMGYRDRLELYNNNPELYENLAQN